tara:strand:- start:9630 stop:10760 length:1131 start_codon:yes stop_codon:yes gene_type:complete
MIYREIGKNREKVSAVGFGTGYHRPSDRGCSTLERSINSALDHGVNFIDTAPVYGDGLSETVLGGILKDLNRPKIFLASKVSPEDTTYSGVLKSVEDSLTRLQTDYLDLCQIHWPSTTVPLEDTTRALEKLVVDGKVRNIGVSNFMLSEIKDTINALEDNPLASIQTEYNFFERSIEKKLLPFCTKRDILLISYSPLSQGNMVNGERQRNLLDEIAQKYNATPGQIVLRWLINHSNVVVIPNTSKPHRAIENANAANISLLPEDIELLSHEMKTSIELVDTKDIRVSNDYSRKVYQTVEEAIENKMNMSPTPLELAEEMKKGNFLKPIRLKELEHKKENKSYDLVEGRLRYWAWVIANGWDKPIPSLTWKTGRQND